MTTDEMLKLLARLDRRLATIADQARETREQAQHTMERLDRLRHDLDRIRRDVTGLRRYERQPAHRQGSAARGLKNHFAPLAPER